MSPASQATRSSRRGRGPRAALPGARRDRSGPAPERDPARPERSFDFRRGLPSARSCRPRRPPARGRRTGSRRPSAAICSHAAAPRIATSRRAGVPVHDTAHRSATVRGSASYAADTAAPRSAISSDLPLRRAARSRATWNRLCARSRQEFRGTATDRVRQCRNRGRRAAEVVVAQRGEEERRGGRREVAHHAVGVDRTATDQRRQWVRRVDHMRSAGRRRCRGSPTGTRADGAGRGRGRARAHQPLEGRQLLLAQREERRRKHADVRMVRKMSVREKASPASVAPFVSRRSGTTSLAGERDAAERVGGGEGGVGAGTTNTSISCRRRPRARHGPSNAMVNASRDSPRRRTRPRGRAGDRRRPQGVTVRWWPR